MTMYNPNGFPLSQRGYPALCDNGMFNENNKMTESKTPGVLNGKYYYKKLLDGILDKTKVVCPSYHQEENLKDFNILNVKCLRYYKTA